MQTVFNRENLSCCTTSWSWLLHLWVQSPPNASIPFKETSKFPFKERKKQWFVAETVIWANNVFFTSLPQEKRRRGSYSSHWHRTILFLILLQLHFPTLLKKKICLLAYWGTTYYSVVTWFVMIFHMIYSGPKYLEAIYHSKKNQFWSTRGTSNSVFHIVRDN